VSAPIKVDSSRLSGQANVAGTEAVGLGVGSGIAVVEGEVETVVAGDKVGDGVVARSKDG
jgi:hypothetical protein